jgi:hypothetical protein
MSSIASRDDLPFRSGFEPTLRDLEAECDGGRPLEGTHFAGRQCFTGRLTGHYRDYGPYPWRWFLLGSLTRKPDGFTRDAVWCDAESLYPASHPIRTIEQYCKTE